MTAALVDYACAYAACGFRPLALAANSKKPVWNDWPRTAPTTPEAARQLLGHHPGNIGVTFPPDLFALDLDRKGDKDGIAAIEAIAAEHGGLPPTLTQRTPSGSEHRIFRKPPGVKLPNKVDGIAPGIDVRAEGGQITCEPSAIDGKLYQWIDWSPTDGEVPEIADAPTWLLDMLVATGWAAPTPSAPGAKLMEGGRNDTLFSDGAAMRRRGFDGEAIAAALMIRNRNDCSPSLPDDEVQTIAASAAKYAPEDSAVDLRGALELVEMLGQSLVALTSLDAPVEFLPHYVDMWIPHNEVTLLAGHGGGGKSYVALSIAVHVALGLPFGTLATTRTNVLFFSGEDGAQVLRMRLAKICRALKIDPAQLEGRLHLLDASDIDPALHREQRVTIGGRQQIITQTPLLDALGGLVKKLDVGLVVVDNASDAYDDDEIKRARVRAFIRSLRSQIARPGRAVLLLAHINKASAIGGKNAGNEDYSGSTAWHNSVRSRLSLIPAANDILTIEHQKANLGAKAAPVRLAWNDGVPLVAGSFAGTGADVTGIIKAAEKKADDADTAALIALIEDFDKRGERVTTSSQGSATVYKLLKGESSFPKATGPDRLMRLLRQLQDEGRIYRRTVKTPDRKWREVFTCVPEPEVAPIPDVEATQTDDEREVACAD